MTIKVQAHPMDGNAMVITFNKHAIRAIHSGKSVSLELITGDKKMKFDFMRDNTHIENQRKKQKQEKTT